MTMRYVVLGAGRQGLAIAHDLARHGEGAAITLVDSDPRRLKSGATRLRKLVRGVEIRPLRKSLATAAAAAPVLKGHDAAVSALPYRFNVALAKAAVRAQVHYCDLGGHTAIVKEQLKLDKQAKAAGVALVPDCGIAPGLANVVASIAVEEVEEARHVRIWCGGLPKVARGPLGYSLLFDIAGLTNEYTGHAVVLRGGKLKRLEAFTELEHFTGPRGLGPLEAFLTSGGTSTAPWTYRGRLDTYEYKTIRYFGHFDKVRPMIELGLLDLEPVRVAGLLVSPREFFHAVVGPKLFDPKVKDLLVLRVDCTDAAGKGVRYRMVHHHDPKTGFTAMEQATGYPTAVVAYALAQGELAPGVRTPERCGLGKEHLTALRARGFKIRRTRLKPLLEV